MQYDSTINSLFEEKTDYIPFPVEKKEDERPLLLSAIWGFTGGLIMTQALNDRVTWPLHLTFPVPLLSLLIPSCKEKLSVNARISSCAASLFSRYSIGILSCCGLGIATQSILNRCIDHQSFSGQQQLSFLLYQGTLITVHLLSRYASYAISQAAGEKAMEESAKTQEWQMNKNRQHLKELNRIMEANYEKLRNFIEADILLLNTFKQSYQKTQSTLLQPYNKNDSLRSDEQVVKEWWWETNRFHYNQSLFICLKDLFEKNPNLYSLLEKKITEKGKEKKFRFILQHEMLLLSPIFLNG